MNTGFVRTKCPFCEKVYNTKVVFPNWDGPFETTDTCCPCCEKVFTIFDPYKYDEDGNILNADEITL